MSANDVCDVGRQSKRYHMCRGGKEPGQASGPGTGFPGCRTIIILLVRQVSKCRRPCNAGQLGSVKAACWVLW